MPQFQVYNKHCKKIVIMFISAIAEKVKSPLRKLKLHSKDVEAYRSDQLYKLISEIVNPGTEYMHACLTVTVSANAS